MTDETFFSRKYPIERKTLNFRISYYVKENFGTEYQGSLGRLEGAVEEEYIVNMKRACFSEKNYRELSFKFSLTFADFNFFQRRSNDVESEKLWESNAVRDGASPEDPELRCTLQTRSVGQILEEFIGSLSYVFLCKYFYLFSTPQFVDLVCFFSVK